MTLIKINMRLHSRYLSDSTEQFHQSNQLILRKLTNAKSDLQTYRKLDRKSLELKQILLNSKFYVRKRRLLDISCENQRIFERINFHRHRKLKPLDEHYITLADKHKKRHKKVVLDKQNYERVLSPLREILDDYRSRRRTEY